jgi:Uma2 family endonuclease
MGMPRKWHPFLLRENTIDGKSVVISTVSKKIHVSLYKIRFMELASLDLSKSYTYADYLKWDFKERVEIIGGKLYEMMPAPGSRHQRFSGAIFGLLWNFMKGKDCQVYAAPFDVRLPGRSKEDEKINTVVQPDVCVICDKNKVDARGCLGAPDIVVEILSPGNNLVEINKKFDLYEQSGVKEYWIVSPQDNTFSVNILIDGRYITSRPLTSGKIFTSTVLPDFSLDLRELFEIE